MNNYIELTKRIFQPNTSVVLFLIRNARIATKQKKTGSQKSLVMDMFLGD